MKIGKSVGKSVPHYFSADRWEKRTSADFREQGASGNSAQGSRQSRTGQDRTG
jgi:hypothetical protein